MKTTRTMASIATGASLVIAGCTTPQKLPDPPQVVLPTTMEERVSVVTVTPLPSRKPLQLRELDRRPVAPKFDETEVRWFNTVGSGTIKGTATVNEAGFETKTCAESRVFLLPVSRYTRYRMDELYNSTFSGYNPVADGRKNLERPDKKFVAMVRSTECNSFGEFMFENLAAGQYYVTTYVRWDEGNTQHGGNLMQRVEVSDGRVSSIEMTN